MFAEARVAGETGGAPRSAPITARSAATAGAIHDGVASAGGYTVLPHHPFGGGLRIFFTPQSAFRIRLA